MTVKMDEHEHHQWNGSPTPFQHFPQHHHDHGSDEDYISDEDGFIKRRSYSDEPYVPLPYRIPVQPSRNHASMTPVMNGTNNPVASPNSSTSSKLHHRHVRAPATPSSVMGNGSVGSTSSPRNSSKRRPLFGKPQHQMLRKQRGRKPISKCTIFGLSVIVLLVWYTGLMITGSQLLRRRSDEGRGFWHPHTPLLETRKRLQRGEMKSKSTMEEQQQRRKIARSARARPMQSALLERSNVARIDSAPRDSQPIVEEEEEANADLDALCGKHAKEAAASNAVSFPSRFALNSKSRVLITGILNPIGFHLALVLKERCGVEVIAGVDPMFPNSVLSRLSVQDRVQILVSKVPKLIQPIILPLIGLDPRKNLQKAQKPSDVLQSTGEVNLLQHKPTHIIHLASYGEHLYRDDRREDLRNVQSPYGSLGHVPDMYRIRSSLVSMEQILQSLVEVEPGNRPHFLYASFGTDGAHASHIQTKLADEVLADTYFANHNIMSTGVRLPNGIYGPWGVPGTSVFDMAERAVALWGSGTYDETMLTTNLTQTTPGKQNFVFVNDIVDGVIASAQYRPSEGRASVLDLNSDQRTSISSVAKLLVDPSSNDKSETSAAPTSPLAARTRKELHWEPTTSLPYGLRQTIAWHLDKAFPFVSPLENRTTEESGDSFRKNVGLPTCAAEDLLCHVGKDYLPCSSECSNRDQCIPSIFDEVQDLLKNGITQECRIILYTQSIGYNVQDLKLKAKYKDDGDICNFAFVPRDSRLVRAAIEKVPEDRLSEFDVDLSGDEKLTPDVVVQRKLDGLNGKLLYRGWILVWVPDAIENVSSTDKFMMKLNPGMFFSSDVKHALYVDENFPVSPNTDDVLFLVSQAHRPALKERRVYRKEEDGEKHKYRLAPEPERKAIVLLAPLKQYNHQDPKKNTVEEKHKLNVYEATKFMMVEIGEHFLSKEKPELKRQREFYERIPTFLNRADLRSSNEPWYRYEMKHWVRSRWLVHDLEHPEARQLRCEWYQEHIQWGNDLDQLSFAHVMAKRELERRIFNEEPDDHIKPVHVQHPELLSLTDAHEWHAVQTEENRLAHIHPMEAFEMLPKHLYHQDEEKEEKALALQMRLHHEDHKELGDQVPLFVRIMSERVMMLARMAWSEKHGIKKKK